MKKSRDVVDLLAAPLAALILAAAIVAAAAPARAQDRGTTLPPLPAGMTPEQLDAARRMLEANPDARKALEEQLKRPEEAAGEGRGAAEDAEAEAARRAQIAQEEARAAALGPYDWRASTYVGNLFLKRLSDAERRTIAHFGHEIFRPAPGAALALENMPVAPGYVVGPGDEIVVRLWGRIEGTHRMVVDRDGKILFPKIGTLYVAGKTFEELKSFIRAKVGNIAEVSSDVTIGQMKGIRVSVVGEVRAPGWYNVSSLHTALQALSLAGGMKDIGSLRRIELRRGGKVAETIDLYDFLLKGDNRSDTRLLQGDTIFVPVVGPLVAVTGEVRRPAIYEMKEERTLSDLVAMAGGFAPSAFTRRVQVERLEGNTARVVLDVDAAEVAKEGTPFPLADGDIVRVLPIVRADENVVTLEGNVYRPGKYELKPGMTVGTLLPDENAFLPETYFDYAYVVRLVPPDLHKEIVPVNLRAIVLDRNKAADVALMPRDTVRVFPRSAFKDAPRATISGEVRLIPRGAPEDAAAAPDRAAGGPPADNAALTFEIQAGTRAADLVKMAGGVTRTAALDRAEIVRVDANRTFTTIYFNLGKALEGDPAENVLLENEDHVRIHSIYETRYRKTVTVSGEVNAPGDYVLTEGMKLSDLLFKAGGFRESAYGREAELVRREIGRAGDLVRRETLVVYPERAAAGDNSADIPLREYDLLVVRQIPDWGEKIQVTVGGEVRFPGIYSVLRGERLSSLVGRAGGFTADAYLKAARFTRVSTRKAQQQAIDKLVEDLELEVAQKAQEVSGVLDKEDVEANKQVMEARRALIAQLKRARAKGR
ncbi:MAG: SLBB domain-containing protein, partial [Gemmatimonadota bacterium]